MRQKTSLCGTPPTCALGDQKGFSSIVSETIELLSGARSKRQKTTIMKLLAAVPELPIDAAVADTAAEVRRALEKGGEGIGMADSLIAGTVLRQGGALLTHNHRHFNRVDGLVLSTLE